MPEEEKIDKEKIKKDVLAFHEEAQKLFDKFGFDTVVMALANKDGYGTQLIFGDSHKIGEVALHLQEDPSIKEHTAHAMKHELISHIMGHGHSHDHEEETIINEKKDPSK